MIDFHPISLKDRGWAEPILFSGGLRSCDSTFPVMYTWRDAYGYRLARLGGFVLSQMSSTYGTVYLWPIGQGDMLKTIDALRIDADARGIPFQLVCVTPEAIEQLDVLYPAQFSYEVYRDAFDYVYHIDKLAELSGKKLHAKRNHINRFVENYPDWEARPLTESLLPLCREIDARWHAASDPPGSAHEADNEKHEDRALRLAMQDFTALGLDGLLILAHGDPVAFAFGKQTSEESYNIHFEKADVSIQGSYAIINREFARWIRDTYPSVRYINREDDMGVEGLRRAKASYYPDIMIEKYTATWRG